MFVRSKSQIYKRFLTELLRNSAKTLHLNTSVFLSADLEQILRVIEI